MSESNGIAPDRRDLRWNLGAAMIDAAGWGLGMGLISRETILPRFIQHLTDSPVAVGLIPAVMYFGQLLPGILTAGWIERLPRVKHTVMWLAAIERLMLLLMVPFSLWLGLTHRTALLAVFFGCWLVLNTAMGANLPGYYKLIAVTIPPNYRGRLYGIGGAVAGLLGAATALLAGTLLTTWGFPSGYAACFGAAFVAQTVSVLPIGFMREPVQPEHAVPPKQAPWHALRLVRDDPRLLWLTVALALFGLNQMASAFYTVYAVDRFQASDQTVAGFTAVLMGVRMFVNLLVGWLGDRHGNRAAILVATIAGGIAAGLAWLAPELGWMYAVFALNEVAVTGWAICSANYVMELCPPERSGTYTAVFSLVTGPFRIVLPLLGGALVRGTGYAPLFAAAVAGGLMALALVLKYVPEPRNLPVKPTPAA